MGGLALSLPDSAFVKWEDTLLLLERNVLVSLLILHRHTF